jgi:NHL repeat
LLARLGDYGGPERPSPFIAPHGIAVDSSGAIYVAELSYTVSGKKLGAGAARDLVTLQKLCPLPEGQ